MSDTSKPSVDLSHLLGRPANSIEEPQALPNGLYVGQIVEYEQRIIGQKNTPAIEFTINVTQPVDVDPSECDLPKKLRFTQWLTEDSLFYFRVFLENTLGIEGGGRTLAEMLPESRGRQLQLEVVQDTYTPKGQSESKIVNKVNKTMPLG